MHFLLFFLVILCCRCSDAVTSTKINYLPNGEVGGYDLVINNTVQPTINSPLPRDGVSKLVKHTSNFNSAFTSVDERVIGENSYLNVHSILKQQKQQPVRMKYPLKNVLMVPSVRYVNGVPENVKLRFAQIGPYAVLIVPVDKLQGLANSAVPPEIRDSVKAYIEVQEPPSSAPSTQKTKTGYAYAPPTYKSSSSTGSISPTTPSVAATTTPSIPITTPSVYTAQPQKTGSYIYPEAISDSSAKSAPPDIGKANNNGFVIRVANPAAEDPKSGNNYQEFFVPSRPDQLDREEDDKTIANPVKYSGSTDASSSQFGEVYNNDHPAFRSFTASEPLSNRRDDKSPTIQLPGTAAEFKEPAVSRNEQTSTDFLRSGSPLSETGKQADQKNDSGTGRFKTTDPSASHFEEVYRKDNPAFMPLTASDALSDRTSDESPAIQSPESVAEMKNPAVSANEQKGLYDPGSDSAPFETGNQGNQKDDSGNFQSGWSLVATQDHKIGYALFEVPPPLQPEFSDVSHDTGLENSQSPHSGNARFPDFRESSGSDSPSFSTTSQPFNEPLVAAPWEGRTSDAMPSASPSADPKLKTFGPSFTKDEQMPSITSREISSTQRPSDRFHDFKLKAPLNAPQTFKSTGSSQRFHDASNESEEKVPNVRSNGNDVIDEPRQSQDEKPSSLANGMAVDSAPTSGRGQEKNLGKLSDVNPTNARQNLGQFTNDRATSASSGSEQQFKPFQTQNVGRFSSNGSAAADAISISQFNQVQLTTGKNLEDNPQGKPVLVPLDVAQVNQLILDGRNRNVALTPIGTGNHPLFDNEKFKSFIQNPSLTTQLKFVSPSGETSAVLTSTGSSAKIELPSVASRSGHLKGNILIPKTVIPLPFREGVPTSGPILNSDNIPRTAIPLVRDQYNGFDGLKNIQNGATDYPLNLDSQQQSNVFGSTAYDFRPVSKFDYDSSAAAAVVADNKNFNQFYGIEKFETNPFSKSDVAGINPSKRISGLRRPISEQPSSANLKIGAATAAANSASNESDQTLLSVNSGESSLGRKSASDGHSKEGFIGSEARQGSQPISLQSQQFVKEGMVAEERKSLQSGEIVIQNYLTSLRNKARIPVDLLGRIAAGADPSSATAITAADRAHFNKFDSAVFPDTKQVSTLDSSVNLIYPQLESIAKINGERGPTADQFTVVVAEEATDANESQQRLASSNQDRSPIGYRDQTRNRGVLDKEPATQPIFTPSQRAEDVQKFEKGRLPSQFSQDDNLNFRAQDLVGSSRVNLLLAPQIEPNPALLSTRHENARNTEKGQQRGAVAVPKYVIPEPNKARIPLSPQAGGSVILGDKYASGYERYLTPALRRSEYQGARIVPSQPASVAGPHTEKLLETLDGLFTVTK